MSRPRIVCALGVAVLLQTSACGEEMARFDFEGRLEGRVAGRRVFAALGPGARFVPSAEGQGVEPGESGPAVTVPLPDELHRPAGTLAFRFRASRTIRFSRARRAASSGQRRGPDRAPKTRLVESPIMRIDLAEKSTNTVLSVRVRIGGEYKHIGDAVWGWITGGKWYHLALAWDAPAGKFDVYLNGVLQNNIRMGRDPLGPWKPPEEVSGALALGGVMGTGETTVKAAVDSLRLYSECMTADEIAASIEGRRVDPLRGEGRTDWTGTLDLTPYELRSVYEADFTKPLSVAGENELFEGDRRARLPEGKDWVLEGPGRAWTEDGRLHFESLKPEQRGHVVLWNTRAFPADFLLEFDVSPKDSSRGLNIIFFAARSREGGTVFDLDLPRRAGVFKNYTRGAINCYHVSYWAVSRGRGLRRTVNFRKNAGFYMPACGVDRIGGQGPGPHKVRLLKIGGRMQLETRGQLSAVFEDDGRTYGPVWKDGAIGLRQMSHTVRATYSHFRVWKVEAKR